MIPKTASINLRRIKRLFGAMDRMEVLLDGRVVGWLRSGAECALDVPAGTYTVAIRISGWVPRIPRLSATPMSTGLPVTSEH